MTDWIVETLIATTLLMLIVLAIRTPVANRFGARAAYLLWLLPAVRMVTPPLPEGTVATPMAVVPSIQTVFVGAMAPAGEAGLPWATLIPAIWLGGAALFLTWHLLAYRRFMRRAMHGAEQLPMMDRGGVEVCASAAVPGPFASGIFVKSVVLPADWRRRYRPEELRLAMAHELEHHRRCDLSANLVALVLLALHWFNPFAHLAHRAFRADQELACDAVVLDGADVADRHAYGLALVKSSIGRRPVALAPLGSGDDLKRRLRMLGSTGARRGGGALALGLVGLGVAMTASGGLAAETGRSVAEDTVQAVREVAVPASVPVPLASEEAAIPQPPEPPQPPAVETDRRERRTIVIRRDRDEMSAEEQAALADAGRAAEIAGRDAERAGREAARAGERAARFARRHVTFAVTKAGEARAHAAAARAAAERCAGENRHETDVRTDGYRTRVVVCTDGLNEATMNATTLSALSNARASLAAMDFETLSESQRAMALAELDEEIARLRQR